MEIKNEGVLMLLFLLAVTGAALAADCGNLAGWGTSRELPPREDRVRIFACAGVERYVRGLDELDRDVLFLRAALLPVNELAKSATETGPPRAYGELIPLQDLVRLKELVDRYYGGPAGSAGGPERGGRGKRGEDL